ncbi:uncharacterized protein LOC143908251 [Temnothorax americanus]|uniref:uncharacterized protein LOC143905389 n=1 Tax=Temnothorax americanus TaxID=1964332 RepID=UPI0040686F10
MPWLVVKFDLENTVEAVPKNWYCERTSTCYWPPESCNSTAIEEKIKHQQTPDRSLWKTYPAAILGQYDNLKLAKKKANKAKTTNELSSNNEDIRREHIRKKQRDNKNRNKRFSDTDETSLDDDSNDGNIYPVTSFLNSEKTVNDITQTNSASTANSVVVSEDVFSKYQSLNAKFQKELLKEISLLHLKVNNMLDSIDIIINTTKVNTEALVNIDKSEVSKIVHLFPMTEESLIKVEEWINASMDNKVALTEELSRIGGSNVKELIKRIMYRILLNEVGMLYSWEGAKKKKAFKNLNIAAVILDVVRKNPKIQNATELEAINHIKAWLVRSKDRYFNAQKKINQVQPNPPANAQDDEDT